MKVSSQRLPESQVLLEVEVDPEQMERSLDRAYKRLAQRVDVPGFRKGKTPRNMLERHIGRDRIVQEAIDILLPEAYSRAVDEQSIEAIDRPSIELTKDEPLTFKATIPVRPTIELGDYSKLSVAREPVEVDEAEVNAAIEELRTRYAIHEPVERPVQTGDIVRADVRIIVDGNEVFKDDDAEFRLRDGATILLPGFAEGIPGAVKGEAKEVPISVPPGERPLSGKDGVATLLVKEVKQEVLPELNDSFAQQVGEGFAALGPLRDRLRNDIRERLESQSEESFREQAVAALADSAEKLEYPPVMVDREIEHFVQEQARHAGHDVDSYLELVKRTPEQIREELLPSATQRVRRSLVLTRFTEAEGIKVEPEEIDAEIDKIVTSAGEQAEQLKRVFSSPDARTTIERSLLTRKSIDRLTEIAGANGASAPKAGKSATKRKPRKSKRETEA